LILLKEFLFDFGQSVVFELFDGFINGIEGIQIAVQGKGLFGLLSVVIFQNDANRGHDWLLKRDRSVYPVTKSETRRKNPLWLQQHADATGMPLILGKESESVLLGAAILGANASGVYASVTDAMRAMSGVGAMITPNPAVRSYHEAKYEIYRSLYAEQLRHREVMAQFV
jgi:hypothetical protein